MSTEAVVEKTCRTIFEKIIEDGELNWGKIVAMFCVAGGMAVDCVAQAHPDYVKVIINTFVETSDKHLVPWLVNQGGWVRHTRVHNYSLY